MGITSNSAMASTNGTCLSFAFSAETLKQRRHIASTTLAPYRRRGASMVTRAEGGINHEIRKNEEEVVDFAVVAELSKPLTAYCRCWRSGTFPLCDGSHVKHNKTTGDNVGPLLVKK